MINRILNDKISIQKALREGSENPAMTGLLTFHWADDYGAMLQALGLKRCLERLGEHVEVIPYAPFRLVGRYWWCPLSTTPLPDGGLKYRINRPRWRRNLTLGGAFWARRRAMKAFRRRFLSDRLPVRRAERLSLRKYRCVFVGSDQVWNPDITIVLDDAYIGNVKDRGACRLTAYAASMGRSSLPEADRERFARCVNERFFAVSVREASGAPFLENLLHRRVDSLADPVLLLRREDWEEIMRPPPEKDYVLLHYTEHNEEMVQFAGALARQLGKRVVQTALPLRKPEASALRIGIGPGEFLGYIHNAVCVVTNSFHAAAFSVLFEKQFLVFGHSAYNARLTGLLERLGLNTRMRDGTAPPSPASMWEEIDWQAVEERLETERGRAVEFIRNSLEEDGDRPEGPG